VSPKMMGLPVVFMVHSPSLSYFVFPGFASFYAGYMILYGGGCDPPYLATLALIIK